VTDQVKSSAAVWRLIGISAVSRCFASAAG